MFKVGDKIVYPMHGAGVIETIEERAILDERQSYYIIKMPGEVKVMVPTDVPWAVVFAGQTNIPRHPSPLYEAATEGILLFIIMYCLYRFTNLRRYPGALGGMLGMLYAVFRILCEQFRAPDIQIGFLTSWGLTMGQLLSALMFIAGAIIFAAAFRKKTK